MTTVYAVVYSIGGYAREDASVPRVGGVYSHEEDARIHSKVVHGDVVPVEIDVMPAGILESAKQLGMVK